jgi:hypothetical protein
MMGVSTFGSSFYRGSAIPIPYNVVVASNFRLCSDDSFETSFNAGLAICNIIFQARWLIGGLDRTILLRS